MAISQGVLFGTGVLVAFVLSIPTFVMFGRLRIAYESFFANSVRGAMRVWLKLFELEGIHVIKPATGHRLTEPCVFVSNHPTLTDSVYFTAAIPRVCLVAKKGMGKFYPLRRVVESLGFMITGDGGAFDGIRIINQTTRHIQKGGQVLFCPEGTRSPSHGLLPFRTGFSIVARRAGVQIQPIILKTEPPFLNHSGRWFILPDKTVVTTVEYLEPVNPPEKGQERQFALELEHIYKDKLSIHDDG